MFIVVLNFTYSLSHLQKISFTEKYNFSEFVISSRVGCRGKELIWSLSKSKINLFKRNTWQVFRILNNQLKIINLYLVVHNLFYMLFMNISSSYIGYLHSTFTCRLPIYLNYSIIWMNYGPTLAEVCYLSLLLSFYRQI